MILIPVFLILTPGLISLLIHRAIINKKNKTLEIIATYSIYSLIIILIIYAISYISNPNDNINLSINNDSDLYSVSFILKYIVLAINASVILPALLYLIKILNWYIKKLALLKTQKSTEFIINDYSKQINEYVFGNADFFLNLSAREIQDLVVFINKTNSHKGKLYLFAPEFDLKVNTKQPEIEIIAIENISNAVISDNDSLLLIGDQIQENDFENIATKFQSRVFRLSFDEDSQTAGKGNLLLMPNSYNEKNQNTKHIQELLLQSLLGYVFALIQ